MIAQENNALRGAMAGTFTGITGIQTPLVCEPSGFQISVDTVNSSVVIVINFLLSSGLPSGTPSVLEFDTDDAITVYTN